MNARKQFQHTRMALEVLRESEDLMLRFAVSIRSGSSTDVFVGIRLNNFLRSAKRRLFIQLSIHCLKMVCGMLFEATLTVFRALWLKMAKTVKSLVC
jgi:hypothetical protein